MKDTLVVNFIAGPGARKTTLALSLAAKFKWANINAEYVSEYAKDVTWNESFKLFDNQLLILAEQYHRVRPLLGKVDIVLQDTSLLNSLAFLQKEEFKNFEPLILELCSTMNCLNVFVERVHPYHSIGRIQTEVQSKELDKRYIEIMNKNNIPYIRVSGEEESILPLFHMIKSIKSIT